jgi:integrase
VHIHTWSENQLSGKEDEVLRRGKDSANRQLATFKAALNYAFRNGLVASDIAWRTVVPFRNVGRRRQGYISMELREALLAACDPDIRALVTAMLLTAARPGELAGVTAQHFDAVQGTLQLDGKTGHRSVALSSAARKFFEGLSANKIGGALLLTTRRGKKWSKGLWTLEFNAASKTAELPVGMVMYSLRHTAISDMIAGGLDAFVVAKIAGTSTTMIDKHYGHLRIDRTRALLDTIKLISGAGIN